MTKMKNIILILLTNCIYLRGFVLFGYNTTWQWTMACKNWEFQWVLPIFHCNVWIIHVQYILHVYYVCIYASINPFGYLRSQYCFTFFACSFCIHYFTFCFGTVNIQNLLFKDKYFDQLYRISQLYLSTNSIYRYLKYY